MLIAAAACTPIPAPDAAREAPGDWGATGIGAPLPEFELTAPGGERLEPADLIGSAVVMTFASLRPGPSQERSAMIIERLAEVRRRFPAAERLRLLVILLDEPPAAAVAELTGAGLEALVGPSQAVEELASAFGVAILRDPDGIVHASETVVVDAEGVVQAMWPGVASWSQADVLEMVSELLRR